MRPSEFKAIRPHLERAMDDIDYYLTGLEEREKFDSELSELYDLMAADKTPPEVKGQGKPELTPEQYAALEWRTAEGEPITDEQREAVLAGVLPGQAISDKGWAALQFAWRGGWRESSRQAAAWLRNAGETVAADGIDVALSRLPGEPRDAAERSGYREAMRTAAEYVRTTLTTCLEEAAPAVKPQSGQETPPGDSSEYAMTFDGSHWHIAYEGERGFVNDSKGAQYVAQLLNRPQQGIPCQVLHGSTEASLKENDPAISKNDALEELAQLRDELAELRRSMEEKPHEILPEDREREQAINARIRELTGLGGKPRQKEVAGAARTAVFRAVDRFKDSCRKKGLNAFAEHLDAVLETGETPVYNGDLSWKISIVTPDVTM